MTDEKRKEFDEKFGAIYVLSPKKWHSPEIDLELTLTNTEVGVQVNDEVHNWIDDYVKEEIEKANESIIKKLQSVEDDKWKDAEHCKCLGFAIEVLKGNVEE